MSKVNDFSKAKVGDKVWSLHNGEGVIDSILERGAFPIIVQFKTLDHLEDFMIDGKLYEDAINPDLYRTQPTVTAPEPKEKVTTRLFIVYSMVRGSDVVMKDVFASIESVNSAKLRIESYGHILLDVEELEREFEV